MSKLQPKRDAAGRYYRNIGYTKEGSRQQPKFYLGRDEIDATERLVRIVRLWQWVRNEIHKGDTYPIWGPFLDIAKAIGAGKPFYTLPRSRLQPSGDSSSERESADSAYSAALLLLSNPVIDVVAEDESRFERGQTVLQQMGRTHRYDEKAQQAVALAEAWRGLSGQRPFAGDLHEVLGAFNEHLNTEFHDPTYDCISDHGKTKQRQVKTLLRLLPNTPLADMDFDGCQEIYNVLRRRPAKEDGKPYEKKTCQHLLATLGNALDFADLTGRWTWKLPPSFSRIKKSVFDLEQDNDKPVEIPTYSVEELKTLWLFARPNERLLIALAMNCGMGADQIGRLTIKRICLREDEPSYIKARRLKKKVIGRWRLWDSTKTLIRWAIANRPACDHDILVLNGRGNPLYGKSRNGDRSRQIANAWYRLLNRIRRKDSTFKKLGFNSLRDTSADFVRQIADGELASIHLAHKHHTTDSLLHCYTNPNFNRLAKVHERIEKVLVPMWEAVSDPTQEPPRPNSNAFAEMEV
jgi:integrase